MGGRVSIDWKHRTMKPISQVGCLFLMIALAAGAVWADGPFAVKLRDVAGKTRSLDENAAKKAVVVFFINTECPVSNHYSPEYTRLAKVYEARDVAFFGVHPDPELTLAQAAAHAKEYGLRFPILLDPDQTLAKAVAARVTPEAFVLSPTGKILYRGRIDDRYSETGKRRDAPTRRDLVEALEAVLAGKTPIVAETKAFGCPLPMLTK